jgi:hypothetical protein
MIRRAATAIVIVTALLFLMASLEDVSSRPTIQQEQ